jgi:hypothetical protein
LPNEHGWRIAIEQRVTQVDADVSQFSDLEQKRSLQMRLTQ